MTGSTKLMTPGGGGVTLQPASSIAADVTVSVPSVNGTVLIPGQASALTAKTAVASTSGTSIDFTGIPSWVKRITVMFSGVSTNGTSLLQIQIGSGSFTTSGYVSAAGYNGTYTSATTGFVIDGSHSAAVVLSGALVLTLLGSNTWVEQGVITNSVSVAAVCPSGGNSPALAGALDRVRITTVNGTDTFDAGSINILYE